MKYNRKVAKKIVCDMEESQIKHLGRNYSKEDPNVALVTCNAYKEMQVEQYLIKTYSSQNTKYALDTMLRFLPAYNRHTDPRSKDKFELLRN